jgi:hypothetical protein
VRHQSGCPKCARGEGHQVYVLTVSYAGGRTRQISVRRQVARTPVTSKTVAFGLEDGGVCNASVRPRPASRVSTAREIVGGLDGLGRVSLDSRRNASKQSAASTRRWRRECWLDHPRAGIRGGGGGGDIAGMTTRWHDAGRSINEGAGYFAYQLFRVRLHHAQTADSASTSLVLRSTPTALPQRPSGWRKLSHLWAPNSHSIPAAEDDRINSRVVAGSSVSSAMLWPAA